LGIGVHIPPPVDTIVLNEFLDCDFKKWAGDNPDIWDNEFGASMWYSKQAFGRKEWERLTHDKIIVHLRKDSLVQLVVFPKTLTILKNYKYPFISPLGIDVHYFYFQKQPSYRMLYADE
jgi:hypothetical protein